MALSLALALPGTSNASATVPGAEGRIDNSALIPKLQPDVEVTMEGLSPDWVKTLVMAQFRVETATPEGTFAAATRVLDHYAEMGVNGLWINPVYERGSKGNAYGNFGPETIEPRLTGATSTEESFQVVRRFVEAAHQRNIRVLFDIVVWGTASNAPLVAAHPEFYRRVDGQFWKVWGGYGFDWQRPELRAWFQNAAVDFIEKTGADGFRVDLAPDVSGYFFHDVRQALYARGKKIILVSEMPSERKDTFDFEEHGVTGWTEEPDYATPGKITEQQRRFGLLADYLFSHDIVAAIHAGTGIGKAALQQQGRGGQFRFYTSNLLCHDDAEPFARGNRVRFAYGTIFAPFIPLWWIGEEWNNPKAPLSDPHGDGVMYFNKVDWSAGELDANARFYEDVKRFIRIRRSFPGISEDFPSDHRAANITRLATRLNGAPNPLAAYARTGGGKAILIVPNNGESPGAARVEVSLDYQSLGIDKDQPHVITDLLTGKVVASGTASEPAGFATEISAGFLGVFLVTTE